MLERKRKRDTNSYREKILKERKRKNEKKRGQGERKRWRMRESIKEN